jgi:hypothetical protein
MTAVYLKDDGRDDGTAIFQVEVTLRPLEEQTAKRLLELAAGVIGLVLEKRRRYGTENINATGLIGLAARLVDKAHRLFNLTTQPIPDGGESEADTLRDTVGYGLIGLAMKEHGEWY